MRFVIYFSSVENGVKYNTINWSTRSAQDVSIWYDVSDNIFDYIRIFGQFGYGAIHNSGLAVDSFLVLRFVFHSNLLP